MATYNYSFSDFPNETLNSVNLGNEIRASAITKALDYITTNGPIVSIVFKETLSAPELLILDGGTTNPAGGLIALHNAVEATFVETVQLKEEEIATNGKFRAEARWLEADAGPNVITSTTFVYNYATSILDIQIHPTIENQDDEVVLSVLPVVGFGDGIVGVITQNALTGTSQIHVNPNLISKVLELDYITLVNPGVKEESMGYITSIDKANNILNMELSLSSDFMVATPTLIKLERKILNPFPIGPPGKYLIGGTKLGASYIPKGYKILVHYTNKTADPKRLYCLVERLE